MFDVTIERFNDREAQLGGTDRHGMHDTGLRLADAVASVRRAPSALSEHVGTYPDHRDHRAARWVSRECREFDTGDSVTLSIHFPTTATPASRARLVRALTARL